MSMALVEGRQYPEHLYYDLENQIWYEALGDGTIRAGFTPLAIELAGEVLVFTPKRVGREFEARRSFALIECGKWVGSARAAFDGVVLAANEELERHPKLLNEDAFGRGWMLIVRPASDDWRLGLTTGSSVGPAFAAWIASEAYKGRLE
jgi:glycine cleavage system H protein